MGSTTNVIMPVLGMSQDSGKLVRWIKKPGDRVEKGEPLMEVETDKATVEIEAPAFGVLTRVTAQEGDEVPVGQVIAEIQDYEERQAALAAPPTDVQKAPAIGIPNALSITPLAARMAADHNLDLGQIKPGGGKIEKADVQAYLKSQEKDLSPNGTSRTGRPILASPKARRLAAERVFAASMLLLAFWPRPAAAGVTFDLGIKGGISFARVNWIDMGEEDPSKFLAQPVFGAFVAINLNKVFTLQPEVYLQTRGGKWTEDIDGTIIEWTKSGDLSISPFWRRSTSSRAERSFPSFSRVPL